MKGLKGKVAIVTGAARGIGRAIVKRLCREELEKKSEKGGEEIGRLFPNLGNKRKLPTKKSAG